MNGEAMVHGGGGSVTESLANSRQVWRLVAAVVDGKDVPVGHSTVMEVGPDGTYSVKVNGRGYARGSSTSDSSTSPAQTDVTVSQGPDSGKTLLQIHKIEGAVMIACQAKAGASRPSEFASPPGSGQNLSVWLRDEKALALDRRNSPMGRLAGFFWLPILLFADDVGTYKADLEPRLGYWGSLAAIGLGLVAVQMVVCLLLKWGWRAGLAIGVSMALVILVDGELTRVLEPTLKHPGAVVVALSTAAVAGFVAWQLLSRLLKVEAWRPGSDPR